MNPEREAHRAAVDAGYASLKGYVDRWGGDCIDPVEYYIPKPEPKEETIMDHLIEASVQWLIVLSLLALLGWSIFK